RPLDDVLYRNERDGFSRGNLFFDLERRREDLRHGLVVDNVVGRPEGLYYFDFWFDDRDGVSADVEGRVAPDTPAFARPFGERRSGREKRRRGRHRARRKLQEQGRNHAARIRTSMRDGADRFAATITKSVAAHGRRRGFPRLWATKAGAVLAI